MTPFPVAAARTCHCICLWIPLLTICTCLCCPFLLLLWPRWLCLGKGCLRGKGSLKLFPSLAFLCPGLQNSSHPVQPPARLRGAKPLKQSFLLCVLLGRRSFQQPEVGLGVGAVPRNPVLCFISLIYHEDFSQSRGERHCALARFPGWAHDSSACSPPSTGAPRSIVCSLEQDDMAEPVLSTHLHFLMWRCLASDAAHCLARKSAPGTHVTFISSPS